MLAVLIYLMEAARRILRKLARGVFIVADSFQEAQQLRRSLPRGHMEE